MPPYNEYTIVGLSANLKGQAQAFLTDLCENRWVVMLCHDESYLTDPHAIAAIVGDKMVGHVCRMQNTQCWGLLEAQARAEGASVDDVTLYAEMTSVDRKDGVTEHVSFGIRLQPGTLEPVQVELPNYWNGWGQDLPSKPMSREDVLIKNARRSMKRILSGVMPVSRAEIVHQLEAYRQLTRHDLSFENFHLLSDVTAWLYAQDDPELQQWGKVYAGLHPAMSEEERLVERLTQWWPAMLRSDESQTLWRSILRQRNIVGRKPTEQDLNALLTEMLHQLDSLPGQLSNLLDNGAEFFKGLFYLETPSEVLSRLYGCLIVCYYAGQELKIPVVGLTLIDSPMPAPPDMAQDAGTGRLENWIMDWASKQKDSSKSDIIHQVLADYELEKSNPQRLQQLAAMDASCRESLTIHTDKIEVNNTGAVNLQVEQETIQESLDPLTHPLAQYFVAPAKKKEILDWMLSAIKAQSTPKDKLAVLKAAMSTKPAILSSYVTVEAFNAEFSENVSPDSFKDWIRGNHGKTYKPGYLNGYTEQLEQITGVD